MHPVHTDKYSMTIIDVGVYRGLELFSSQVYIWLKNKCINNIGTLYTQYFNIHGHLQLPQYNGMFMFVYSFLRYLRAFHKGYI